MISGYLPGLSCNLSWDPSTRIIAYDYNENTRITKKMPESFTVEDFILAGEIVSNWRAWRSHEAELSFNPKMLGLASAETPVEALHLFIHSF